MSAKCKLVFFFCRREGSWQYLTQSIAWHNYSDKKCTSKELSINTVCRTSQTFLLHSSILLLLLLQKKHADTNLHQWTASSLDTWGNQYKWQAGHSISPAKDLQRESMLYIHTSGWAISYLKAIYLFEKELYGSSFSYLMMARFRCIIVSQVLKIQTTFLSESPVINFECKSLSGCCFLSLKLICRVIRIDRKSEHTCFILKNAEHKSLQ